MSPNENFNIENNIVMNEEEEYRRIVMNKTIEEKSWLKLNKFDIAVLKSCIDFNNFNNLKRYYRQRLGEINLVNLFDSLKRLESIYIYIYIYIKAHIFQ